jgi:hypothetical protein
MHLCRLQSQKGKEHIITKIRGVLVTIFYVIAPEIYQENVVKRWDSTSFVCEDAQGTLWHAGSVSAVLQEVSKRH